MTEKYEVTTQAAFFSSIEKLAANPKVEVAKIREMMDIQEHILDRNAKQEFSAAMVQVQANIPIVPKDKTNKGTSPHSKYSSYEMIMKHCKSIYTSQGFAISTYEGTQKKEGENFSPIAEGEVRIFGDVMHEGGWSKTYYVDIPLDDKGPQGTKNKTLPHAKKSSLSYGRSALMCMVLNIPTGDGDDGNAAGQKKPIPGITKFQLEEIKKLTKDTKTDETKFMVYLKNIHKTAKIEELNAAQATQVTMSLNVKLDRQNADN